MAANLIGKQFGHYYSSNFSGYVAKQLFMRILDDFDDIQDKTIWFKIAVDHLWAVDHKPFGSICSLYSD